MKLIRKKEKLGTQMEISEAKHQRQNTRDGKETLGHWNRQERKKKKEEEVKLKKVQAENIKKMWD